MDLLQAAEPFYIVASEARGTEPTRVLKDGETFAVFDPRGDMVAALVHEHGLYNDGTRFLSQLRLTIAGMPPLLLSSRVGDENYLFGADLTNPDVVSDGAVVLARDLVHVYRSRFLLDGTCFESLRLANYSRGSVSLAVALEFTSDFADIFEVRGTRRTRRGTLLPPHVQPDGVVLAYRGLDGVTRRTHVRFDPPPTRISPAAAYFDLSLDPQQTLKVTMTADCEGERQRPSRRGAPDAARQELESRMRTRGLAGSVVVRNERFQSWVERSANDVRMMITDTAHGQYPYAGVPWFSTPFGRDGIITALETLWLSPSLARGVLEFLAATQADALVPEQDAEPGKILHEARRGEMAALGEVPFGRYYGSIDATPLFVVLAGAYYERTGDAALVEAIWPNVLRALEWVDRYGDRDGDGFVEYARQRPTGLAQQGWKDSQDSVFHEDGAIANGPIALCEVQAYVYEARRRAAQLARARGDATLARRLDAQADELRRKFEDAFWCEEISTYALALDGDKRQCRVRSSNAGHCLYNGIASPERARRVAATLLDDRGFSGWGIRTLAAGERRYNPMSYHNGSIWPHDNALIAAGFARYGLEEAVARTLRGLFDASRFFDLNRMPELFCGFHQRPGEAPTLYPVACAPQAWAAGAVFLLLHAACGLHIDALARRIVVRARELPPFLDLVVIQNLEVAGAPVDLRLERQPHGVAVTVPQRSGDLEVHVTK